MSGTSQPYYRAPWFLALGHLSSGTGWTAHGAAQSWLRDNGLQRLPKFALGSALAGIPPRLHKLAVGALLTVGLWQETPEGYELRGQPAPERGNPVVLAQHEQRRDSERERAAARKRAQRERERQAREGEPASVPPSSPLPSSPSSEAPSTPSPGPSSLVSPPPSSGRDQGVTSPVTGGVTSPVTSVTAPVTSPVTGVTEGVTGPVTSPVTRAFGGVTSPVTEPVTGPLSRRDIPSLSSSLSGENSFSGETNSKEQGGAGGGASPVTPPVTGRPVTPDVTGRVTAPVTGDVTHSVTAGVTPPVTERPVAAPSPASEVQPSTPAAPPSSPPSPSSASQEPPAAKRRPRRPQPEMTPVVRELFEYWRSKLMPGAEPILERIRKIEERLAAGRSPEDIRFAIDGVARSDWHRTKGHIDLPLICRADKFDQYLAWGRGTADPNASIPSSRPSRTAPRQPTVPAWGNDPDCPWKPAIDLESFAAEEAAKAAAGASR